MKLRIEVDGHRFEVDVERTPTGARLECEDEHVDATVHERVHHVHVGMRKGEVAVALLNDGEALVDDAPVRYRVDGFQPAVDEALQSVDGIPVAAAMTGRIVRVLAKPGATVQRGDALFVLEAMKMQNEIGSPASGNVKEVLVAEGDVVESGRLLARLTPGS